MIEVNSTNKDIFFSELAMMHRLRKQVFRDRLGWPVQVVNEMEFDQFDIEEAVYILCLQGGEVVGSARLLPTTQDYLLGSIFPFLVKNIPMPSSSDVWEITRFCADHKKAPKDIMSLLLLAIMEFGLKNKIKFFVSIADIRTERLIQRAGWLADRLGETYNTGTETAVAQKLDVNAFTYKKMLQRAPSYVGLTTTKDLNEAA